MQDTGLETIQYCGFKIGNDEFAIPVMDVQEVIKPLVVTPVPLAQDTIRGLINLRGQIVTCLSLRRLFGQEDDLSKEYMNIIVKGKDGLYSLIVDEVTDILEVESQALESVPDTLNEQLKEYVSNVYKSDKGLTILLNVQKIINGQEHKKREKSSSAENSNNQILN